MRKEILNFRTEVTQQSEPYKTRQSGVAGEIIAEKYEVLNLIASGANGSVYKVRHTEIDKILALKTLKVSNRTSKSSLLRLQREARALSKLRHPNIIGVHALASDAQSGFVLIMDYLEGTTLEQVLAEKGALPFKDALSVIKDICSGLSAAHAEGVLHRDLKPSNIVLVDSGSSVRAVLIDFGLAKLADDQQKLTSTAAVIGTPAYMSPEQGRGGKVVDNRSDIYTVGCLLFEVLHGHRPFEAETSFAVLMKHLEEDPPAIKRDDLTAAQNQALSCILRKAMNKDPEARYQNAEAMELDLDATISGDVRGAPKKENDREERSKFHRTIRIAVAAVLVLTVAAGAQNGTSIKDALTGGDSKAQFGKSFATAIETSEFKTARHLATEYVKSAEEEGNAAGQIDGLLALAKACNFDPVERSQVTDFYSKARKIAEDNDLSPFKIDMEEADFYYWQNVPQKMYQLYAKWLDAPEDASYQFIIPYRLADCKFTEQKLEEADAFLKIAKPRIATEADEQMFSGLHGCILVSQNKYKDAYDLLKHTLRSQNLRLDPIDAARFYIGLSNACTTGNARRDAYFNARGKLVNIDLGHEGRGEMMKEEVLNIMR